MSGIDAVKAAIKNISTSPNAKKCSDTIRSCLSNLIKSPSMAKFKKLQTTFKVIQDNIVNVKGGLELMKAVGFQESPGALEIKTVDTDLIKATLDLLSL